MTLETNHGVNVVVREGNTRMLLGCTHQRGLIYMVPAEKSWVCYRGDAAGPCAGGIPREN